MFRALSIYRVGVLELCGKAVDVWSTKPYPANVLSNLYPNAFEIDGVKCAPMEVFLRGVPDERKTILTGKEFRSILTDLRDGKLGSCFFLLFKVFRVNNLRMLKNNLNFVGSN